MSALQYSVLYGSAGRLVQSAQCSAVCCRCAIRENGDLFWDGLHAFRCVYKGLRLPPDTSQRKFRALAITRFDSRFKVEGEGLVGWNYLVECIGDPDTLFGMGTGLERRRSSINLVVWDPEHNKTMWRVSLVSCERMPCSAFFSFKHSEPCLFCFGAHSTRSDPMREKNFAMSTHE